MDWNQLKYFQTLANLKSFTKAAEELALSQPALSRSIIRLEEEIGVPLFERKSRGAVLNTGKSFSNIPIALYGKYLKPNTRST